MRFCVRDDRVLALAAFAAIPGSADCSTTMNGPRECSTEFWETFLMRLVMGVECQSHAQVDNAAHGASRS
jgi:hypothetical protein